MHHGAASRKCETAGWETIGCLGVGSDRNALDRHPGPVDQPAIDAGLRLVDGHHRSTHVIHECLGSDLSDVQTRSRLKDLAGAWGAGEASRRFVGALCPQGLGKQAGACNTGKRNA